MKKTLFFLGILFLSGACLWWNNFVKAATVNQEHSQAGITFSGYDEESKPQERSRHQSNNINNPESIESNAGSSHFPHTNEKRNAGNIWIGFCFLVSSFWVLYHKKSMEDIHHEK